MQADRTTYRFFALGKQVFSVCVPLPTQRAACVFHSLSRIQQCKVILVVCFCCIWWLNDTFYMYCKKSEEVNRKSSARNTTWQLYNF